MKAHELAAILLQNPDNDVLFEEVIHSEYSSSYNITNKITSITTTPSGTFLNYNRDNDIKHSPSNKPEIGSFYFVLKNSEYDNFIPEDNKSTYFEYYINDGCVINHGSMYSYLSYILVLTTDEEDLESIRNLYPDTEYVYIDGEIECVRIIESINEDDWSVNEIDLSISEAVEYFKNLLEKYYE